MMLRVRSAIRALVFGLVLTTGAFAATARADEGTPSDRAQTFEAVTGPVREDVPGGPLLVAAYALIWLCVFGYIFRLVRLQRGSDENLARLQQDLQKAAKRSETAK